MEQTVREILEREFEPNLIKKRKGRGGMVLDYLETASVIRRLNEAFESEWNFRILEHGVDTEAKAVWVLGELTAVGLTKQQFGAKDIYEKSTLGDNLKSAASDCLKKCATLFGVGLHLYEDDLPGETVESAETKAPSEQQKNNDSITESQKAYIMKLVSQFVKGGNTEKVDWLKVWLKNKKFSPSLDKKSASEVIKKLEEQIKK